MKALLDLIEMVYAKCDSWVKVKASGLAFYIDPIDQREVRAHYGSSHMVWAMFLHSEIFDCALSRLRALALLDGLLLHYDESLNLKDFHHDFNNFAICNIYSCLKDDEVELKNRIIKLTEKTRDSNHDTVNWLPMRWYVNLFRGERNLLFLGSTDIDRIEDKIRQATNADGGIEDRLPKGLSYNLQYNIATVSLIQFLRCNANVEYDISNELGFLLRNVLPDGDVNYQGRGVNQIFGWGPWVYLLSSADRNAELEKAIAFLKERLPICLENNNIYLNEEPGQLKL
jgi:hypothetical protein